MKETVVHVKKERFLVESNTKEQKQITSTTEALFLDTIGCTIPFSDSFADDILILDKLTATAWKAAEERDKRGNGEIPVVPNEILL